MNSRWEIIFANFHELNNVDSKNEKKVFEKINLVSGSPNPPPPGNLSMPISREREKILTIDYLQILDHNKDYTLAQ